MPKNFKFRFFNASFRRVQNSHERLKLRKDEKGPEQGYLSWHFLLGLTRADIRCPHLGIASSSRSVR